MGLLKKIFKPVSKVLDKVIPNEIKPALPYLAALAPVFAPAGMQGLIGSTMGRRALTSGLLNIGGQLAQEGNEGDINLLSAGLGALTGAMTTPGAATQFRNMQVGANPISDFMGKRTALQKATDFGLEALAKGSDIFAAGAAEPFSMAGVKAATLPTATATGDVMQAQAKQLEKQAAIDAALAEAEALADSGARAAAIRNAMNAYGFFTDEEIEDTIASAGYKAGGRVGFNIGGDTARGLGALAKGMQGRKGESEDLDLMTIKATLNQVHTNNDDGEGGGMAAVMEFMEKNPEYKVQVMENIIGDQGNKIMVAPIEKSPVNILDQDGIKTIMVGDGIELIMPENKAKGGRVGFKFGGIDKAIKMVEDESIKESAKMVADMPDIDLMDLIEEFEIKFKRKPMNIEELKQYYRENYEMESPVRMKEKIKEKVTVEAKDGGLMATRINMENGGDLLALGEGFKSERLNRMAMDMFGKTLRELNADEMEMLREEFNIMKGVTEAKDGGLMDLGGKEMDLRKGGFVPIGKKERADDVPARLSKNEFVMTADAVRAAGGGSVNKGAKRMYNLMNSLEAKA